MGRTYKKYYTRALSLLEAEYWELGDRVEIPKVCDGIAFDTLFVSTPNKGVSVYYPEIDPAQSQEGYVDFLVNNEKRTRHMLEDSKELYREMKKMIETKTATIEPLFDLCKRAWPSLATVVTLGEHPERVSGELLSLAVEYRALTETIYLADEELRSLTRAALPESLVKFSMVMRRDEFISKSFPDESVLEERLDGYVLYKGNLFSGNTRTILSDLSVKITDASTERVTEFKGSVAYPGHIIGKVRLVFESQQVKNVLPGEILVAGMTTPDMLLAMKNAAAFITDEGGITCHAAVVAREMRKPCVIGTQIATEVLKDGNLVEIKGDKITILQKT